MNESIWEKIFSSAGETELTQEEIEQALAELAQAARDTEAIRTGPEHQRLLRELRDRLAQEPPRGCPTDR